MRSSPPRRYIIILTIFSALFITGCIGGGKSAGTSHPTFPSAAYWPTNGWRVSTPKKQGMNGDMLEGMLAFAKSSHLELHGLVVIRHGYIVKEVYTPPYSRDKKHSLYSCTKSFISALLGIAIDRGYIEGTSQRVLDVFPEKKFLNPDQRKDAMTLENLATMTSGLQWAENDDTYRSMDNDPNGDWVRFVLDAPMTGKPGGFFLYSSGNSHILSGIIQKKTGMNLRAFAQNVLFGPLGISDVDWDTDPQGIPVGGWGLKLTPRDMAKLGYLYLHGGNWDGERIVSEAWVRDSTLRHVGAGGGMGYGYQWWIDPALAGFAALGRYCQAIYVVPSLDLVTVFTAGIDDIMTAGMLLRQFIAPACVSQ